MEEERRWLGGLKVRGYCCAEELQEIDVHWRNDCDGDSQHSDEDGCVFTDERDFSCDKMSIYLQMI